MNKASTFCSARAPVRKTHHAAVLGGDLVVTFIDHAREMTEFAHLRVGPMCAAGTRWPA